MASEDNEPSWNMLAAVGAWLLPGLGHYLIGQRQRAVVLAVAIGGLWFLGVLIGGIGVINHQTNQWWFMGQMLAAPSVAVDLLHVSDIAGRAPHPGEASGSLLTYEHPLGRPEELGTLFTALAGLLNLLAVIDVIYREERQHEHNAPGTLTPASSAPGTGSAPGTVNAVNAGNGLPAMKQQAGAVGDGHGNAAGGGI